MDKLATWLEHLQEPFAPDEYEFKQLLGQLGVQVPRGRRFLEADANLPSDLDFPPPYVAKVCSPDILHKTERQGVSLDLGPDRVSGAVADLFQRFPDSAVLVEEQIRWQGNEFILGALVDPNLGPALMVGAGGILTELYQDVAFRLVPCTQAEAARMIDELTIAPVLKGFRGLTIDGEALARLIALLSELVAALGPRFYQLDINPVVFSGDAWVALDARLMLVKMPGKMSGKMSGKM